MLNKFTISFLALLVVVYLFCSQKPIGNFQINSHNIQLLINPQANSLTAIDTIEISYKEKTDHIYFLLHDSLNLEKVTVGHLAFDFIKADSNESYIHKAMGSKYADAAIYKVKIPFNLSPNSMRVYYSGYIWEPEPNTDVNKFGDFLLTNQRVILKKDSCWYPTVPNNMSCFSVSTCSPENISLYCKATHAFQQADGEFIINRWIYPEPVDGISIFSIDG